MIFYSQKDPAEIIILSVDWSGVLGIGETINSATWVVTNTTNPTEDTAAMVSGSADLSASPIIRQKIQGGTNGSAYLHQCVIVTGAGRTLVQCVEQIVKRGG